MPSHPRAQPRPRLVTLAALAALTGAGAGCATQGRFDLPYDRAVLLVDGMYDARHFDPATPRDARGRPQSAGAAVVLPGVAAPALVTRKEQRPGRQHRVQVWTQEQPWLIHTSLRLLRVGHGQTAVLVEVRDLNEDGPFNRLPEFERARLNEVAEQFRLDQATPR